MLGRPRSKDRSLDAVDPVVVAGYKIRAARPNGIFLDPEELDYQLSGLRVAAATAAAAGDDSLRSRDSARYISNGCRTSQSPRGPLRSRYYNNAARANAHVATRGKERGEGRGKEEGWRQAREHEIYPPKQLRQSRR